MKVNTADMVTAAAAMVILGVFMRKGRLIDGLLIVYLIMAALFAYHIFIIRRKLRDSVAVYGTVTGYHTSKAKDVFPIVAYETEEGREISSVYTVGSRHEQLEIGSEEMICYSPDDPMFFYFAGRENELTSDYARFILYGGCAAVILLIIRIAS